MIGGTALATLSMDGSELTIETPWGPPSGSIAAGQLGEGEVFFLNRHGCDHRIPPHAINYRANIAALHQLEVSGIVAVYAVGGIGHAMTSGTLALPHQIIDYTWGRAHSYCDGADTPLLHIDFSAPYCPDLRARLLAASQKAGVDLIDQGVYGVTQGPRLETAAEIARMARDGCDLVGMTGMPEAALARELGIPFAGIALVVNPAAGKTEALITMEDIGRVMIECTPRLLALLKTFCGG